MKRTNGGEEIMKPQKHYKVYAVDPESWNGHNLSEQSWQATFKEYQDALHYQQQMLCAFFEADLALGVMIETVN